MLKEYEGSLPRSQQPSNGTYLNPDKSILILYIPCIMFIIIRNHQNNVQFTKLHCLTFRHVGRVFAAFWHVDKIQN